MEGAPNKCKLCGQSSPGNDLCDLCKKSVKRRDNKARTYGIKIHKRQICSEHGKIIDVRGCPICHLQEKMAKRK